MNKIQRKNIGDADKKSPEVNVLVTATVLNTKICEAGNKISDTRQ